MPTGSVAEDIGKEMDDKKKKGKRVPWRKRIPIEKMPPESYDPRKPKKKKPKKKKPFPLPDKMPDDSLRPPKKKKPSKGK
jgi:hypothetical protein